MYAKVITEIEQHLSNIKDTSKVQVCALSQITLLGLLEKHKIRKNINYSMRLVVPCDKDDSDKIINHFSGRGLKVNEFSMDHQAEIIILY